MEFKANLLTQNSKIKKSTGKRTFNFGIPAFKAKNGFKTCPNAQACAVGCYARGGAYAFSNVAAVFEQRLAATKSPLFPRLIAQELKAKRVERLRIHDSGDFYSGAYTQSWFRIMEAHPEVQFYAYTKMISAFKAFYGPAALPGNFTLIYSFGGTEDHLIDIEQDRHSYVFERLADLKRAGYADARNNDAVALGKNPKIGLVYHGAKSFSNTIWGRVKRGKRAAVGAKPEAKPEMKPQTPQCPSAKV